MKRVYIGNTELTTIATRDSAGGGGGDDTQKWVDFLNGTLTEFTVPEGVTKVRDYAFEGYSSLTSVTIPNSVTNIGDFAFNSCTSLTEINLPDGLTNIGEWAFADCQSLQSITVKTTTPPTLGTEAFEGSPISTIYVPSSSVDAYKAASGWKDYASKIKAIQ